MRNLILLFAVFSVCLCDIAEARNKCCKRRPKVRRPWSYRCPPINYCCPSAARMDKVDPAPALASVAPQEAPSNGPSEEEPGDTSSPDDVKWRSLFNGNTLGDWKSTEFGGEGEVFVEDGSIHCEFGQYLTGVTYEGKDLPTNNYEIELEASRQDGFDFFCGLTFPINDSHVTFVVGGWGGSVVGISSIDDMDASENDTTAYMVFKNKQWYKIRVRVTTDRIQTWIDDKVVVDRDVKESRLSTRIEVDASKPLGLAAFDTHAAYRNIRIREVSEAAE